MTIKKKPDIEDIPDRNHCVRERFQIREKSFLSELGALSTHTKRRNEEKNICNIRTPFQLDRDRIVYSNAFRRLKHKTQVFYPRWVTIIEHGSPTHWKSHKLPEILPGPCD